MARLSNYTREQMADALVKHRFAAEGARLVAEAQELFRQLYDHHYDADVQRKMAALQKRFVDAFATDDKLTANIMGRRIDVGSGYIGAGKAAWKVEVAKRPVLRDQHSYSASVPVEDGTALALRLIALDDARQALREATDPARREALGALQQFSTGKRLAEDWPEAMPVIGDLIPEDDRALPVVQVAGLNAKFDLPPSERLAA